MLVYEIKPNGYLGQTLDIDPKLGITSNYTYTAPPTTDKPVVWQCGAWVETSIPEPSINTVAIPDTSKLADSVREQRNKLLQECDWTQIADAPVDQEAWREYRQALRDITAQPLFPLDVIWPTKP